MKWLSVVGARPQFVKAAAVCRAVAEYNAAGGEIQHMLLHTGQHYDWNMSGAFFEQMSIPAPDFNLGVGSGPHGAQIAAMLAGIDEVILDMRPDVVIVYGDTNSTLAGALAACKAPCLAAHVEAGLRCGNRRMAEEINRIVADHVCGLLFCPTAGAVENLRREGLGDRAVFTGDVMLDALFHAGAVSGRTMAGDSEPESAGGALARLGLKKKRYFLATIHRAENTDTPGRLSALLNALEGLAKIMPVVIPLHPRTKHRMREMKLAAPRAVMMIEPVSYFDMLSLEGNAALVMTDSGGVQREAYFLGTPAVIAREETEWPETLQSGLCRLAGAEPAAIIAAAETLLAAPGAKPDLEAFGGGRAAARIVSLIARSTPT